MPDTDLFDKTADFDGDVCRNIVSLRESVNLFDDLSDGDEDLNAVAAEAEARVKRGLEAGHPGVLFRAFHYSTAIAYPFEVEPYLHTRFGDGTFGVWYGSLDMETTVYETAFHMIRAESAISGITETIIRERAIYDVRCRSILIDLRGKQQKYPQLVAWEYDFTRQIGKRLYREGHPGLLTPSARCDGTNLAVFNPQVLTDPRLRCHLTYYYDPIRFSVRVEQHIGQELMVIDGKAWL